MGDTTSKSKFPPPKRPPKLPVYHDPPPKKTEGDPPFVPPDPNDPKAIPVYHDPPPKKTEGDPPFVPPDPNDPKAIPVYHDPPPNIPQKQKAPTHQGSQKQKSPPRKYFREQELPPHRRSRKQKPPAHRRSPNKTKKRHKQEKGLQSSVVKSSIALHPTMSVVVCASGDRYAARVRRCFDSIRRQVGVRHQDIEIVLMVARRPSDSEGISKLRHIAKAYNATVVRESYKAKGYNYAFARNAAARHCTGAVLCFLDADVILDSSTFQQMFRRITNNSFVLVFCAYAPAGGSTDIYQNSNPKKFRKVVDNLRIARAGLGGCVFIPTAVFNVVRGWDEKYVGYGGPDHDMYFRLKQAGFKLIDLTQKAGIKALHQWHKSRAHSEQVLWEINEERCEKTREGKLPLLRNPRGYGGIVNAVSVLVPHHPLRPASVLKKVLSRIDRATEMPTVVDLYVQGPCQLPNFKGLDLQVNVIQKKRNMGMAAPCEDSIRNMLERKHAYWAKVDDNALIPSRSIDKMANVLSFERDAGKYNVGCVQLANDRQASELPCGIRLSRQVKNGLPVFELDRCAIAFRKMGKQSWVVGDMVGSGHSLFRRDVFERGVRPDQDYFVGYIDFDMCLQMHVRGILCALLTTSQVRKEREGCYPKAYKRIRRHTPVLWESAHIFERKWAVIIEELM